MKRSRCDYTLHEVELLMRQSETTTEGHTAAKHLVLSNAELARRYAAESRNNQVTMKTAFTLGPESIRAIRDALNSPPGQQALAYLDEDAATDDLVCIQAQVEPVGVRYACGDGDGDVRAASVPRVAVWLVRKEWTATFGLMLLTAFPLLAFSVGAPAWQREGRPWTVA
jgi:hypothetical protein